MTKRITGIDALRGLDMLLLCGGAAALQQFITYVCGDTAPAWLMQQFRHADWGGAFTCWDLVMPLFIFITGASLPFAFSKYREKGGENWRAGTTNRVIRRGFLLFLLGMLVQGNLASAHPEHMSLFCNTLQAIAEGYLITAFVLMFCGVRGQIIACTLCMLVYWALLRFVPYNGQEAGLFLPDNNLALYIDCVLQGAWQDDTPYTWILTALSFGALTLMGSICGSAIQARQGMKTTAGMAFGGAACLLAACVLEADTPLIKHIYTTTAVLWSGGWCIILLSVFHLLFDCGGTTTAKLAFPLQVIGCNALLAYLLTEIHGPTGANLWTGITHPLLYGIAEHCGNAAAPVCSLLSLSLLWLFLLFLYRHKAILRV